MLSSLRIRSIAGRLIGILLAPIAMAVAQVGPAPAGASAAAYPGRSHLQRAIQQARLGDIAASIGSVKDAFPQSQSAAEISDNDAPEIASTLVTLSQSWRRQDAPPEAAFDRLLVIVLPAGAESPAFLLPAPRTVHSDAARLYQPELQLPATESVGAELVRWAVLARRTEALHERLRPKLKAKTPPIAVRILAVQLAAAQEETARVVDLLKELATETPEIERPAELEWLCHAVMPAVQSPQTEAAGLQLFEAVLKRADELPHIGLKRGSAALRLDVARRQLQAGRAEEAARIADGVATRIITEEEAAQPAVVVLRRTRAAQILLQCGRVEQALEILGAVADDPNSSRIFPVDRLNLALPLGNALQKLPPAVRLDLLRRWALPRGERTATREFVAFVPVDAEPQTQSAPRCGLLQNAYSTTWHLLLTAQELGRLDELLKEFAGIERQTPEVRGAQLLGAILRDRSHDGQAHRDPQTRAAMQRLLEEDPENLPNRPAVFSTASILVASEAAREPDLRPLALSLLSRQVNQTRGYQTDPRRAHLLRAQLELSRMLAPDSAPEPPWNGWARLQPKYWVASSIPTAGQHARGNAGDIWCAGEGCIQRLSGSSESNLTFEFPLTGRFQISFECRGGSSWDGDAGFGGAKMAIHGIQKAVPLWGIAQIGYQPGPSLPWLAREAWNRYAIEVEEGVVRYRADGQLVHADAPGTSAPWLTLGADLWRMPMYRNFQFKGTPEIPRAVSLLPDDRLRGWSARYYRESQPDPLTPRRVENPARSGEPIEDAPVFEPDYRWMVRNGELVSPLHPSFWPEKTDSWLTYQRPLCDGDSLKYEFHFVPGQSEALPTIGRHAYRLSSEGITRQALGDGPFDLASESSPSTVLEASAFALKQNDWNVVEIRLNGDQVTIAVNGAKTATIALDPQDERMFGFYHDAARTSLRVRNVVLSGKWPAVFDDRLRQAIEWPEPKHALPSTRFLAAAIDEDLVSENAFEIYRRALTMDPAARYAFLHRWVMPNSSHASLRLEGGFTPKHPSPLTLEEHPVDVALAEARKAVSPRMVQTGGNFVCPAILLVLSALETERIDELVQDLAKETSNESSVVRNRTALLGVIALLQEHIDEANSLLWECSGNVTVADTEPQCARWGEVAFASLAIEHPDTRENAYLLLERIRKRQLQWGHPGTRLFGPFVRLLDDQARYLMAGGAPEAFGAPLVAQQWRAISHSSARANGMGHPVTSFDVFTGDLALRGTGGCDVAYFQSPLLGNYEVTCHKSQFSYQQSMLLAAGASANPVWKADVGQTGRSQHVRTPIEFFALPTPIPMFTHGYDCEVVVRNGRYASSVNGQPLYETQLPKKPDPWLGWMGQLGESGRFARRITITGNPEIPAELDLLAPPDLKGWITDYFGVWGVPSPYPWKCEDGVLACEQYGTTHPGRVRLENIIRYHRPFFEDGEITYEFLYDPDLKITAEDPQRRMLVNGRVQGQPVLVPGQLLVAPALDRMVFLLEPDGVKLHWLTDGRFERTDLLPDNVEPLPPPDGRHGPKLPLKTGEWNSVQLAVRGDTVLVRLNDQLIAKRDIEPTNLRTFGLFHYVNDSGVRVRNMRYRGDWPKKLPAVAEQELAKGAQQQLQNIEARLPSRKSYDFTKSKFPSSEFGYHWEPERAAKHIHPTAAGLRFDLPPGASKPVFAGLHTNLGLSGDFCVTLEYADLKTTASPVEWGTGLEFKLQLKTAETGLQARDWHGERTWRAIWHQNTPLGDRNYDDETIPNFPTAGRVRLVRHGPNLYYLIAEPGSETFQLVSQRPIGTDDLPHVMIEAVAADQASGTEFVVKSLTIRAEKLPEKDAGNQK